MRLYAPAVLPQNSVASKQCLRKIILVGFGTLQLRFGIESRGIGRLQAKANALA
jgi:hypothetical protein